MFPAEVLPATLGIDAVSALEGLVENWIISDLYLLECLVPTLSWRPLVPASICVQSLLLFGLSGLVQDLAVSKNHN